MHINLLITNFHHNLIHYLPVLIRTLSSILRANPYSKVTDLFGRIPLPTLFYKTRGCSPWRPDAVSSTLGGWALPLAKEQHRTFPEPRRAHPTPPRGRSLAHSPPRFALQQLSARWGSRSERNEGSLGSSSWRGPARSRCRVGPTPQFRNLRRMPFRGNLLSEKESNQSKGPPLATTHSRPIAVHAKPFSTSVHKGHTCVVATSTKICTRDLSTRAHAQASTRSPRPPTSSSFFHAKRERATPPTTPASAPSFFRAAEFGR